MRYLLSLLLLLTVYFCCSAVVAAPLKMRLAVNGKARCFIVCQPGATVAERHAADELARTLTQITGAPFVVRETGENAPNAAIIVGPGPLAKSLFPDVRLDAFGPEQVAIRTKGGRLLLAGGQPRGTLYAVYRFLQDQCGVRWWTPWAATIPRNPNLSILGDLAVNAKPAFESRDPFWLPAFDENWAARNFSNSQHARLTEKTGGKILYKGFVHTFYPLVPPAEHFATHPEWYSLRGGKRIVEGGQLCLTNLELQKFVAGRVKEWLRETPDARIVSVSQNDWFGACECDNCKALDEREGSHAGTMLAFVNAVAADVGKEFPHVAIDTLAYQYTRKAPKTIKPLPNVIVRLCSIECNFAAPLEDKSNKAFADDLRAWSKLSSRLYIWDYVTNFGHYVQPHPNWFVLGPNVRFFHQHGVRGLFEQGAYQSHGGEMAEMRAWVLARLLWNPYQDDRKLINEFLDGYYGKPAARPIRAYLALMEKAARGYYLGIGSPPSAPFLDFATMSRAERLWQQAEDVAKSNHDYLWRVRQAHLPVRYVFLSRWTPLRREALKTKAAWPLPASRKAVADYWLAVATGPGPAGWSPITHLNEGGLTPQAFVARFAQDPPDPALADLPERSSNPPAPTDIANAASQGVDAQDDMARLWNEGEGAEIRADALASDGLAVWMPGTHHEWAFQVPLARLPARARNGRWDVYALVRIEKTLGSADAATPAFSAGIYDTAASASRAEITVRLADTPADGYKAYRLGTVKTNADQYIWIAPPAQSGVRAVWVDRVFLVPAAAPGPYAGWSPDTLTKPDFALAEQRTLPNFDLTSLYPPKVVCRLPRWVTVEEIGALTVYLRGPNGGVVRAFFAYNPPENKAAEYANLVKTFVAEPLAPGMGERVVARPWIGVVQQETQAAEGHRQFYLFTPDYHLMLHANWKTGDKKAEDEATEIVRFYVYSVLPASRQQKPTASQ